MDFVASTHHVVLNADLLQLRRPITKFLNADLLRLFKCIILLVHAERNCGAAAFFVVVISFFIFYYVMLAVSSSLGLTPSKYLAGRLWLFSLFSHLLVVLTRSLCKKSSNRAHLLRSLAMLIQVLLV